MCVECVCVCACICNDCGSAATAAAQHVPCAARSALAERLAERETTVWPCCPLAGLPSPSCRSLTSSAPSSSWCLALAAATVACWLSRSPSLHMSSGTLRMRTTTCHQAGRRTRKTSCWRGPSGAGGAQGLGYMLCTVVGFWGQGFGCCTAMGDLWQVGITAQVLAK